LAISPPDHGRGRAIGILHADRPEPHGIVTMDHLEQLEAFAECLAVAFESAVLEEKSVQQRVEVDNLCAYVDELLSRSPDRRCGPCRTVGRDSDMMLAIAATSRFFRY